MDAYRLDSACCNYFSVTCNGINWKNDSVCKGIEVNFAGDGTTYFIDEKGVIAILKVRLK